MDFDDVLDALYMVLDDWEDELRSNHSPFILIYKNRSWIIEF